MPTKQKIPLEQLKEFLNKLFQFESQDLDFGVYKILYYKRKEIKKFIDELLVDKVKTELKVLTKEEVKKEQENLLELEENPIITEWIKAKEENDKETIEVLEKKFQKKIQEYQKTKTAAESAEVSVETENQIYNHLTLFFSRYYDKGDFISKRRFGKNEKYVVPYNGEETHFYWANHDQYYIKSSENFQQYSFKSPRPTDPLKVHFKLTEAHVEQGNVKEDENKFFILSAKEPTLVDNELTIFFEYRALTEDEKKEAGTQNKQENLNANAVNKLHKQLSKKTETAVLWEKEDDEFYLLKKLNHYTKKNNYDFFIHKNLKSFLQRELDFYIKSELINVDDLYVQETETHFERIKHNLKAIKVFKNIADTIIKFLAQIEDFQKKLWEKKKFVIATEWIITIDKLIGWLGEKIAEPILKDVIKNKNQVEEWKELFGEEIFKDWKKIGIKNLYKIDDQTELGKDEADEKIWLKLPIDTAHFNDEFKWNLLNHLSDKIDVEENSDGLVIHSDNFHGLTLITEKNKQQVQSIYIDPPYNTNASEIIYKNSFKHSSWASLLDNTIIVANEVLNESGLIITTIDEYELNILLELLKKIYSEEKVIALISIINNPSGRSTVKGISVSNEFAIWCTKSDRFDVGFLPRTESQLKQYPEKDKKGRYQWRSFLRAGGANDFRYARPKLFYPLVKDKDQLRIPKMKWSAIKSEWEIIEKIKKDSTILYPISNNTEYTWRLGVDTLKEKIDDARVRENQKGNVTIDIKFYLDEKGVLPKTIWDNKLYNASAYGTTLLRNIMGSSTYFSFPKSVYAVKDSIRVSNCSLNDVVLDFFPGSGTTFHATQLLNKEDNGRRKCILIEQGSYVYTVILPRIKKVAYTFDWKEGRPKNGSMNGLGVFVKYQQLEQYEEALENISFNLSKEAQQAALEFEEYIPKYFLEFETKNSATLVNTDAMQDPWSYNLKVWDGYTYDTQKPADLVETFNYLLGLHVHKYITKEIGGKKYQFVYGHNNSNKKILVVWRNIKDWKKEDYEKDRKELTKELKNYEYDLLYVNGQAHLENYLPIEQVFKSKMIS